MKRISLAPLFFGLALSSTASAQYIDFEIESSTFCGLLETGKLNCTSDQRAQTGQYRPDPNSTFTKIGLGNSYACGITTEGTVECWGGDGEGQTSPPTFDSPVVKLTVGRYHACAIDAESTTKCWGQNVHGQTDVPAELPNLINVHIPELSDTCGITTNGESICWGYAGSSSGSRFIFDILSSQTLTDADIKGIGCGIRSDLTAACWDSRYGRESIVEFNSDAYQKVIALGEGAEYAACALTLGNDVDCASLDFPYLKDNTLPLSVVRLDGQYKAIEKDYIQMYGLTTEDRLVTITNYRFGNAVDHNQEVIDIVNDELDAPEIDIIYGEYYGASAGIELFFDIPKNGFSLIANNYQAQIFRDGEFLAETSNENSYLDKTAITNESYTYTMRPVHEFGNLGGFSEPLTVFTTRDNHSTIPSALNRAEDPQGLKSEVYWYDVELFWDRDTTGFADYYEIRRDGQTIATTRGISFYDASTEDGQSYQYDVLAIGEVDDILGISSVTVQIGTPACR